VTEATQPHLALDDKWSQAQPVPTEIAAGGFGCLGLCSKAHGFSGAATVLAAVRNSAKCPKCRQSLWRKCDWKCVSPAARNRVGYVFIWKSLPAKLAFCTYCKGQPPLPDRPLSKLLSGLKSFSIDLSPKTPGANLGPSLNHRIIKSLRLENTSKIMQSSRQPNTTMLAQPCPEVSHLHFF